MESLINFSYRRLKYGQFKVTYRSPKTGKTWTFITDNSQLIDAVFNTEEDEVKQKDLQYLKKACKQGHL